MTEEPGGASAADEPRRLIGEERSSRRIRRSGVKPTRRSLVTGGTTLVVLIVLAVASLVIRGVGAVHLIRSARDSVSTAETDLRQGRVVPGQPASRRPANRRPAHRLTNDPIWYLASHLPLVGTTMQTTCGLAAAAAILVGTVLPTAGATAATVDGTSLRSADGGPRGSRAGVFPRRVDVGSRAVVPADAVIRHSLPRRSKVHRRTPLVHDCCFGVP